jgi:hypothetical protein
MSAPVEHVTKPEIRSVWDGSFFWHGERYQRHEITSSTPSVSMVSRNPLMRELKTKRLGSTPSSFILNTNLEASTILPSLQ